MGFSGYSRLWADRRVRLLYVAAVFARIPNLAIPLVLTLMVVEQHDGTYAQAGFVAAVETLGAGVGAPLRGRLIDRLGLRRTLVPSIVAVALIYPAAAFAPYALLVPLAFLMGLFLIPVFTIVRMALAVMVEEDQRRIAFAADAIAAEASFLVGPAIGAILATQVSPAAAVLAVGGCGALAGLIFLWLDPPMRSLVTPESSDAPAASRSWVTAPVVFLFIVSGGTVVALIGADLAIVAVLREIDAIGSIWLVFIFWGVSSLVGGLIYGALPMSIRPTHLVLALGILTVPVGLSISVWSLGLLLIPAGFLCAPAMTASSEAITRFVPEDRRGEAMGWQGTAYMAGGAASSPLIGASIDGVGAWGGFAVGGVIAVICALVSYGGLLMPGFRVDQAPMPIDVRAVDP